MVGQQLEFERLVAVVKEIEIAVPIDRALLARSCSSQRVACSASVSPAERRAGGQTESSAMLGGERGSAVSQRIWAD
jgi:hypothetical protein